MSDLRGRGARGFALDDAVSARAPKRSSSSPSSCPSSCSSCSWPWTSAGCSSPTSRSATPRARPRPTGRPRTRPAAGTPPRAELPDAGRRVAARADRGDLPHARRRDDRLRRPAGAGGAGEHPHRLGVRGVRVHHAARHRLLRWSPAGHRRLERGPDPRSVVAGPAAKACSGPTNATFTVFATGMDVIVDPAGLHARTPACARSPATTGTSAMARPTSGSSIPTNHTYAAPAPTSSPSRSPTRRRADRGPLHHRPVRGPDAEPIIDRQPADTGSRRPPPSPSTPTVAPCAAPVADFTWRSGSPRRNVTFTDTSTAPAACPITTGCGSGYVRRRSPPRTRSTRSRAITGRTSSS